MQHFSKNTQSVSLYCGKCKKTTPHRVWDGRVDKSGCLDCIAKLETEHQARAREARPAQEELFT